MGLPKVYLVFPPSIGAVGGAEKRYAGFWYKTAEAGKPDITLVGYRALLDRLRKVDEFPRFGEFEHRTLALDSTSRSSFALTLARLRLRHPEAIFHFINEPPLPFAPALAASHTVFSLTEADVSNYSKRGLAMTLLGCMNSAAIDVLDEGAASRFRRYLPWRARDITVTPNSFVDLDFFTAPPAAQKRNAFVFLGTFLERKQVFRLLEALPPLQEALTARGHRDLTFYFLGRDTESPTLEERAKPFRDRVDIRIFFADRPSEVLRAAKVFFSVQRLENYPSKALLEAMACGCLPVVTDVGKSRRIATDAFARFVSQDFTSDELVVACDAILKLPDADFDAKVATARAFMHQSFSFEAMSSYTQALYERVATAARAR